MEFTDTHTHLFLEEFDEDRENIIIEAIEKKIKYFFLPNIDSNSLGSLLSLSDKYPDNCFPMIGLHPTSVKEDFKEELNFLEENLSKRKYFGIGETGIDLYWDKTYLKQQQIAFEKQVQIAKSNELPVIIHVRNSFNEVFEIIDKLNDDRLTGIFHCFSGNLDQAKKIINYKGFKLGIGGVVTFKNSGLADVVSSIGLEHIVLETDSPYLAPVPYRGQRNKSSYIIEIAAKIAEIKNVDIEKVAEITTINAKEVFRLKI